MAVDDSVAAADRKTLSTFRYFRYFRENNRHFREKTKPLRNKNEVLEVRCNLKGNWSQYLEPAYWGQIFNQRLSNRPLGTAARGCGGVAQCRSETLLGRDMARLNIQHVTAAARSQTRVQPKSYNQHKTKITPSSIPSTAAHTRRAENTTNSTVNAPIRPYISANTQRREGREGTAVSNRWKLNRVVRRGPRGGIDQWFHSDKGVFRCITQLFLPHNKYARCCYSTLRARPRARCSFVRIFYARVI